MAKEIIKKEILSTDKAPEPIAPYSQGVKIGRFIFVSGQGAKNVKTGKTPEDVRGQAKQVLENVKAILESTGASMDDVVKVTVFLRDMNDYKVVNEVYGEYFNRNPPARSCVQAALPRGYSQKVEIEAIAFIQDK